mmetsp:Transcript_17547/g.44660  ORF Transcript_17547/g.44660 Transcript_17547/m.44660 type:complete len:172 (-) Transcript_17547:170-685(-)
MASWRRRIAREAQKCSGNNNNAEGITPLLQAAQDGQTAVVKLLLSYDANTDIPDFDINGTALHYASNNAHLDVIKYLCEAGATREARGFDGSTPLDVARAHIHSQNSKRHVPVVKMLRRYDNKEKKCANCRTFGAEMFCPCGIEMYCGKACQKEQWNDHKEEHKIELASKK